jgi:hypothetical protein
MGATNLPRRREHLRGLFRFGRGTLGLIFKPDSDDRASLLEDERYYSPPYLGPSGWLALDLESAPVDWDEVRELADA